MRELIRRLAVNAAACLADIAASVLAVAQPAVLVDAPAGAMRGQVWGDIRLFKGLPYALAPVGALKWKPPVMIPRQTGERDATEFGPACYQPNSRPPSLPVDVPGCQ
jgi:para-nitrobenzyl esterase